MNKLRFHSIDALRFFAFLKVYFLHVPVQGNFPIFQYLKSGGGIGVAFFFVLSGFLITYLLTFDKLAHGQINLRHFFIRRSFRIWPLFYLLTIIAFILPYDLKEQMGMHMVGGGYDLDWRYSFSFTDNYRMLLLDQPIKTSPLTVFWSLCIEEHFYLLWMVVLFILPAKHFPKFFGISFVLAWVARVAEPIIFDTQRIDTNDLFTNLDYFAAGAFVGYWVARDYEKLSAIILKIPALVKWSIVAVVVGAVLFQKDLLPYDTTSTFFIFRSSIIAILFAALIALFVPQQSKIRIKSKLLNYLGTISYGLYVYHILWIHLAFQFCLNNNIRIDSSINILLFIVFTLGVSILTSVLSFNYFERPFLLLRDKITQSRNNKKQNCRC